MEAARQRFQTSTVSSGPFSGGTPGSRFESTLLSVVQNPHVALDRGAERDNVIPNGPQFSGGTPRLDLNRPLSV